MSRIPLNAPPSELPVIFPDLRKRTLPLVALPGTVPAASTVVGYYVVPVDMRLLRLTASRIAHGDDDAMAVDVKVNGTSVLAEATDLSIPYTAEGPQTKAVPPAGAEGFTPANGLLLEAGDVVSVVVLDNENGVGAGLFVQAEVSV